MIERKPVLLNSLAELGVRPCGACGALVDPAACPHAWRTARGTYARPQGPRVRLAALRPPERRPLRDRMAMVRLLSGDVQCRLLADAYAAPDGRLSVDKDRSNRPAANRLVTNGLFILTKRGGDFEITDEGRATHEKIIEIRATEAGR